VAPMKFRRMQKPRAL